MNLTVKARQVDHKTHIHKWCHGSYLRSSGVEAHKQMTPCTNHIYIKQPYSYLPVSADTLLSDASAVAPAASSAAGVAAAAYAFRLPLSTCGGRKDRRTLENKRRQLLHASRCGQKRQEGMSVPRSRSCRQYVPRTTNKAVQKQGSTDAIKLLEKKGGKVPGKLGKVHRTAENRACSGAEAVSDASACTAGDAAQSACQ
jgi:hypothetical protein